MLLLRSSAGMRNRTSSTAEIPNRPLTMSRMGPQIAPPMDDRGPPVLFTPPGVEEDAVGVVVGTAVGVGAPVAVGVVEAAGVGLAEGVGEVSVMSIWACARRPRCSLHSPPLRLVQVGRQVKGSGDQAIAIRLRRSCKEGERSCAYK